MAAGAGPRTLVRSAVIQELPPFFVIRVSGSSRSSAMISMMRGRQKPP
jgi:hypothetical protein